MPWRWLIPVPLVVAGLAAWWLFPGDSVEPAPAEPGVPTYRYATTGFEEVDALGGASHAYPPVTTIATRPSSCGRILVWRPLRDRSIGYELCGGALKTIRDVHEFFGRREVRAYRCAAGSSLRRGWRCVVDRTTEVARGRVIGVEHVGAHEAVHVRLATRLTGAATGSGTRDFWLRRPDGFPVRLAATNESTTRSALGDVHYRERYRLELLRDRP